MSDAGLIAIVVSSGITVLGAGAGALFGSMTKRRDDQQRRTGERIGRLESEADYRRGYEEGRRAGLEEARKGHGR